MNLRLELFGNINSFKLKQLTEAIVTWTNKEQLII